ncbi:MAG: DUF1800 domain-containing protein [Actinomycetota bacterium]|nr:DUF1800 domain-containing protein [Actinomycetota bacterium]
MSTHTITSASTYPSNRLVSRGAVLAEQDAVRRLVGRLGLGPKPGELEVAGRVGFVGTLAALTTAVGADAGAAATPVPALGPTTRSGGKPVGAAAVAVRRAQRQALAAEGRALGVWWLDRMAAVDAPYPERMTWFWHGHFATSIQKVRFAKLMYAQNETFRRLGRGDFRALAHAMIIDPAMLIWLDGQGNRKGKPNENLAREFMELFSLGVGNYSETDVRQAARALTGWTLNYTTDIPHFNARAHDPGPETVLGRSAGFDATGLVDLLVQEPASPKFVAGRIWTRFVSDTPPDAATMDRLLTAYGPGHDITALIREAVNSPQFTDPASVLVKEPVLWLVGALRALRLPASKLPGQALAGSLRGLGQVPLTPPNVGGWPAGVPWLTTAAALTRLRLGQQLAALGDISPVTETSPSGRIDATAALLGLGGFADRTAAALTPLASQPAQLVGLALTTPEYVVSA